MNTFTCKLKPGDTIYYCNPYGLTLDREIDSILISKWNSVIYLDKYGNRICSDSTLDLNQYNKCDLYFTTKAKRDYALKRLHV